MTVLDGCPAPDPSSVRPEDFAGRYSVYDDGWTGRLLLRHDGERELSGSFFSDRFEEDYRVTATVDEQSPHRLELAIHEFNWMDRQVYTGYLLTQGKAALAGSSRWQEVPFGFFARRAAPLKLSAYRVGPVEPADFAGEYGAVIDGCRVTVTLAHEERDELSGRCRSERLGIDLPVRARAGGQVPHAIRIVLGAGEGLALDGYLFTEPKSAIAGSLAWGDSRLGFYMTRYL